MRVERDQESVSHGFRCSAHHNFVTLNRLHRSIVLPLSSTTDPQVLPEVPPAAGGAPAPAIPLAQLIESEKPKVREIGGRVDGPDPTRYGDWEKNGRCIDF